MKTLENWKVVTGDRHENCQVRHPISTSLLSLMTIHDDIIKWQRLFSHISSYCLPFNKFRQLAAQAPKKKKRDNIVRIHRTFVRAQKKKNADEHNMLFLFHLYTSVNLLPFSSFTRRSMFLEAGKCTETVRAGNVSFACQEIIKIVVNSFLAVTFRFPLFVCSMLSTWDY